MDKKIIAAIQKLSYAFRVILWSLSKETGLTPTQIQLLIYLNSHQVKFCRVSHLAKEFGLTQPTVSDAINSLKKKRLIFKKLWENDRRVSALVVTSLGKRLIKKISNWANSIQGCLKQFSPTLKQSVLIFLMELINSLHRSGIITIARMCITCSNFQRNVHPNTNRPHHCKLTDRAIANSELNIDCKRHNERVYSNYKGFWN